MGSHLPFVAPELTQCGVLHRLCITEIACNDVDPDQFILLPVNSAAAASLSMKWGCISTTLEVQPSSSSVYRWPRAPVVRSLRRLVRTRTSPVVFHRVGLLPSARSGRY